MGRRPTDLDPGFQLDRVRVVAVEGDAMWLTAEVADHLRVSIRTVERLKHDTEDAGIHRPWVRIGRSTRWRRHLLDSWIEELERWQASRSGAAGGPSDGTLRMVGTGSVPVPLRPPRRPSDSKSRPPSPSDATGNLKSLAASLTSKKTSSSGT